MAKISKPYFTEVEVVLLAGAVLVAADSELLSNGLFTIAGGIVAAISTHLIGKRGIGQQNRLLEDQLQKTDAKKKTLENDLKDATAKVATLEQVAQKYNSVKEKLAASSVVHSYVQPVLLLGPRLVGKTSLVMQWHAPWDHSRLAATTTRRESMVPVFDFEKPDSVPHFADPDVRTRINAHLYLRVHDFPGEVDAQQSCIEQARVETQQLRETMGQNVGVVLICMFDSEEAVSGITDETMKYYNGDLFANLRSLVGMRTVDIQRLVIVFNKFDRLSKMLPSASHKDLLTLCTKEFGELLKPLHGVCNPDKVCEIATVCDRDDIQASQGASVVLGEAARGLVHAVAGEPRVTEVIGDSGATTMMAEYFQ